MFKILKNLFAALFLTVIFSLPVYAEKIDSLNANYRIGQDGIILVSETIKYNFENDQKHGIYRYIPYKYKMDDGKTEYINLSDFSVKDEAGKKYKYEKTTNGERVQLKIGDKDEYVTGLKTYVISYQIKGGLRYLESGDEFFWDVNGEGWQVPAEKIEANVVLEKNISQESIKSYCYAGYFGINKDCAKIEFRSTNPLVINFSDSNLAAGENLSVAVSVPKGTFPVVSAGFLGSGLSSDTIVALSIIAALIPVMTLVFMIRHFWKWGRDPKGKGAIVVEYEPSKEMTPLLAGTMLDFRVSMKDLSAEIIYLATKGYLKISRVGKEGVFGKDDYMLTELKAPSGLAEFDKALHLAIFNGRKEIKISELRTDTVFAGEINSVKEKVHDFLVDSGYFKGSVGGTIGLYVGVGLTVGVLGILISAGIAALTSSIVMAIFAPAFVFVGLIILVFGFFMPARTAKGVEAKEQILGFKTYLSAVEKDFIKWANAPKKDPKKFEEYLPFAIMFGVEKEWAKQFEGIYNVKPTWYSDPSGRAFVPAVFVSNLSSFSSATTQTFTAASSSGGSSGGGFSGGGFGGGGGGSW